MFFEDEKDIIGNEADIQISDDGTVTWEDVLSDNGDEDLLSINEAQSNQGEYTDSQSLDEDEQLADILNESNEQPPKQKAFDAFGQNNEPQDDSEDEFDINTQISNAQESSGGNVNFDSDEDDDIPIPRKASPKKQTATASTSSTSPILILLLLVVIVAGGIYYFINNYMGKSGVANQDLSPQTVQEDLNNTTAEDIAQRQEEDITDENANGEDIAFDGSQDMTQQDDAQQQEEQPQEPEKKKIVSVIPTGRANPFLPIDKYLTKSLPEPDINYERAGIPKPPTEYGVEDYSTTRMMTIAVSGIMYDSVKPSAIITLDGNDYFVQKGDKLDNYKIVDIQRNRVLIALGKNIYTANIGEEFNINLIAGKAGNISSKQGGGRQYYTASYEAQNIIKPKAENKSSDNRRYVSEAEVQINTK